MPKFRKFAVAMSTFGVALSIGFVMQNGDAMAARFGTDVPTIEGGTYDQPMAPISSPPIPPGLAQLDMNAPPDGFTAEAAGVMDATPEGEGEVVETAAPAIQFHTPPEWSTPSTAAATEGAIGESLGRHSAPDATVRPGDDQVVLASASAQSCEVLFGAEAADAATVKLTIYAPCQPQAQVSVHHQGMIFTLLTSDSGVARVTVPALSTHAVFMAEVDGGTSAVATADVPTLVNYDRAVLQWQGETGLQIHAREFGAEYGTEGHVWNAAARDPEAAIAGDGGFLMRLGDGLGAAPLYAEVYTFPSKLSRRDGAVQISVEAEITPESCGKEVSAQSIQISPDFAATALDLTMAMPGCDAVGDYLVLNNMLTDLTLAAR